MNISEEKEYERCLNCAGAPCSKACPLHVSPKEFMLLAKQNNYKAAIHSIYEKNPLGFICGWVCPNHFCMKVCTRSKIDGAVRIPSVQAALIEKFGIDFKQNFEAKSNGLKVAVIGAGPAGIGAVWKLLQLGFEVEVFEGSDKTGGCLNLIPEERLPQKAVMHDYQNIFGADRVRLHLNTMVEKPQELLEKGFYGVILAVGAKNINNLNIKGEEYITSYVDYLSNPLKYAAAQKIAIIGGGRVAADCALIAHRQKAKVIQMIVRRTEAHLRMSDDEKEQLKVYGVDLVPLTRLLEVQKEQNGLLCSLGRTKIFEEKCVDDPDVLPRNESFDLIVKAVGGSKITISENPKIICAGDCKNGATTVVEAVASGIEAAQNLSALCA